MAEKRITRREFLQAAAVSGLALGFSGAAVPLFGKGLWTGGDAAAPAVCRVAQYEAVVSTHTYAEGLSHSAWGSDEARRMTLLVDVYEPADGPDKRPAIVLIHGGGFHSGSREGAEYVEMGRFFAARGWVALSIDYRLAGDRGTLPREWQRYVEANVQVSKQDQWMAIYAAGRDAKAAVRWLYANAAMFGINTGYIAAMGGSAGAMLAVMLGVTAASDYRDELSEAEDPTLDTATVDRPAQVHTIIDLWGGTNLVTAQEKVYGRMRFDRSDAPILIVHGTADRSVDFSEAEALRAAYEETGVGYGYYPLEGAGHGAWDAAVDGKTLSELAAEFIVAQQGLRLAG